MTNEINSGNKLSYSSIACAILSISLVGYSIGFRSGIELFYSTLFISFAGFILGLLALIGGESKRSFAWTGFAVNLIYLLTVLVIWLYILFSTPDDFSRGDI